MPTITKATIMIQSMETLLDEWSKLNKKEKKLVRTLNKLLTKIGYEVVPANYRRAPVRKRKRSGRRKVSSTSKSAVRTLPSIGASPIGLS